MSGRLDSLMAVPGVREFAAEQAIRLADTVVTHAEQAALGDKLLSLSRAVSKELLYPIAFTTMWLLGKRVRDAQANGAAVVAAYQHGHIMLVHSPRCPVTPCAENCPVHAVWLLVKEPPATGPTGEGE